MREKTFTIRQLKKLLELKEYRQALAAIDSIPPSNSVEEAELCLYRTEAMLALGDFSSFFVDKALDILKPTNNIQLYALGKYYKARIQVISGQYTDAQENLIESLVYYKRFDDFRGMGRTANEISLTAFRQGDYFSFRRYSDVALDSYTKSGNLDRVAMVNCNIATCELRTGRLKKAKSLLSQIYSEYFDFLEDRLKYNFFQICAIAHAQSNNFGLAHQHLEHALKLPSELIRERCCQFEVTGYVYMLHGDYAKAKELLLEGIKLANTMPQPVKALYSQIYRLLGDVHVLTREWGKAEKYANDALNIAIEINERLEIAACHRILAQVAHHQSDNNKAREEFKESIDLFNKIDACHELAVTRYLAASSGLYGDGERNALFNLAREYFASEEVNHFVEKVDAELKKAPFHLPRPVSLDKVPKIITASEKMKKIISLAEKVAPSEMSILLTGATGTGKDMLARYIHQYSGRTGEFVSLNSAAVPHDMIESELFGFKRGAFTGAIEDKPGLFEMADNGTFYLNEIADSTLAFQAKLLEVIETKQIRRLGENKTRPVSFRVIAATNHDLMERIRENKFRSDLYHRLRDIQFQLPPLNERSGDIEHLVDYFLKSLGCKEPTGAVAKALGECSWPGNVRELEGEIRQLWLISNGRVSKMAEMLSSSDDESEREKFLDVLNSTGWNRRETARLLNLSEATVRYRIKRLGLLEPVFA